MVQSRPLALNTIRADYDGSFIRALVGVAFRLRKVPPSKMYVPFRHLSRLVGVAAIALACHATYAQDTKHHDLELAWKAAKIAAKQGPAIVQLGDQASLKISPNEVFVPQPAADQLMRAMGNQANNKMLGLIVPTDESDWMVVAEYEPSGYINDDDAKDWNIDELFQSLKEGTEQANADRTQRGFPALEITGWVERPQYDASTRRLVWSMAAREQGTSANIPQTVNYNTYALGREGYISLNLLTDSKQVEAQKPAVRALLANLTFNDGKRYADFKAGTDKVAAYGLAALVAGVAAKKLGLLAIAAAFLAKFAKLAILAVLGLGAAISKRFRRKPAA